MPGELSRKAGQAQIADVAELTSSGLSYLSSLSGEMIFVNIC